MSFSCLFLCLTDRLVPGEIKSSLNFLQVVDQSIVFAESKRGLGPEMLLQVAIVQPQPEEGPASGGVPGEGARVLRVGPGAIELKFCLYVYCLHACMCVGPLIERLKAVKYNF